MATHQRLDDYLLFLAGVDRTYLEKMLSAVRDTAGPVPVAAVGSITLNADGSLSGTEARSIGGDFANETLGPGTWMINPDCTGTLTAKVFESGVLVRTSVLSFVADDNIRQIRVVQQSLTVPDGTPNGTNVPAVITFEGRRIFDQD